MQKLRESKKNKTVSLATVWRDYAKDRDLKPVTVRNYNQRLNRYLGDWLALDVRAITKDMVEERHRHIASKSIANSTMRTLRCLLIYASNRYEDDEGKPILAAHPVRRLNEIRAWHRDKRRTRIIQACDLPEWFRAVYGLESPAARDLLLALLFTGMRIGEMINLTWSDVDLAAGVIQLRNCKNGEDRQVPMSLFVWQLFTTRRYSTRGAFVFNSPLDPNKPISACTKSCKFVRVRSGVSFSYHDLRRTFASIADELDIRTEVIAELAGHKRDTITENYTIRSIERLRRASQRITAAILVHGGLMKPTSKVIAVELEG